MLVGVKGPEEEGWYGRMASLLPLARLDTLLLAHVVNVEPRSGMERGRERYLGRRPLGAERLGEIMRAEEEAARELLGFARRALEAAGVPGDRIQEVVLEGKPREALRAIAEAERVDLIVVRGRPEKPGPKSLGKTARFLVDHTPRAALLVR